MCRPLWYRFRYVNDKSGNYSEFSKWTCSAVMAGGTNLPCPPTCSEGKCDSRISGDNSCTFNKVEVGVTNDLQYSLIPQEDGSINWAVVYRYVGKESSDVVTPPSDDASIGDPLGYLRQSSTYSGYTNIFTDIGNNPCQKVDANAGCPTKCSICR